MTQLRSIPTQAPRLAVCWLQTLRRIQEQMAAGCELRDVPCADDDLPALRSAGAQWLQDNCALLQASFDTLGIAAEYDAAFGMNSQTNPARAPSRSEFVRVMNAAITGLWSVMQRLEFLADPIGQRRPRWLAVHAIHQPAGQGQLNYYYLPS